MAASPEVLVGRDTRHTGELVERLVKSALLDAGRSVVDYGVISTPGPLPREQDEGEAGRDGHRLAQRARVERAEVRPQRAGAGPGGVRQHPQGTQEGATRRTGRTGADRDRGRPTTGSLWRWRARGRAKASGSPLDLNGGAAIAHAPAIFQGLGCELTVIGGTPGVFSRTIDPTNDALELLTKTVKEKGCDVGFAFDCDGDRLVVVDSGGKEQDGRLHAHPGDQGDPPLRSRTGRWSSPSIRPRPIDDVVSELGGTGPQVEGGRGERHRGDVRGARRHRGRGEQRGV